jgi:hypothetical protein
MDRMMAFDHMVRTIVVSELLNSARKFITPKVKTPIYFSRLEEGSWFGWKVA